MYQTSLSQKTIWSSDNRSNLIGSCEVNILNQPFLACWELTLPARQNEASLASRAEREQERKKKKKEIKDKKKNKPVKSIPEKKNYSLSEI